MIDAPPVGEWVKDCAPPIGEWIPIVDLRPDRSYIVELLGLVGDWYVRIWPPRRGRPWDASADRMIRAPWSSDLWQPDPVAERLAVLSDARVRVLLDVGAYVADLERRGVAALPVPRCTEIPRQRP